MTSRPKCYKNNQVLNSMQIVLQSHCSYHFRCSKLLKNTSRYNSNQTSYVVLVAL